MKRTIFFILMLTSFLMTFGIGHLWAEEADVLINKLVEKGVLSSSEAQDLRTEMQEESAKDKAETGNAYIAKWLQKTSFKSDLRLRHDTQWRTEKKSGKDEEKYHRNRERFRLRLGMKAETTETTKVGVALASGSGFQNTTNQSYDDHARGTQIFIDKVYASWHPADFFKLTGGKHKNPMLTTPLVWDPDVNPGGYSEELKFNITDSVEIFSNLAQWFIEELKIKDTNRDPFLLAYQLGVAIKPAKTVKFELAGTYYDFKNLDTLHYDADGPLNDLEGFLGYNHKYGQQMIFDSNGNLLNEFGCWEVGARLKVKSAVPFSIFANYIVNEKADIGDLISKGVEVEKNDEVEEGSDPAKLEKYSGDDRDSGWLVGFTVGSKKKKGDWYLKYHYQVLEDYAFPAVFVDSDFHGGGTNNKGHYVQGRYCLADNIQARTTGFFTERDDERKDGQKDEDRIQVDMVFTF